MRSKRIMWNPVSEGYPAKKNQLVLVTVGVGNPDPVTTVADWRMSGDGSGAFYITCTNTTFIEAGFHVRAWAEFPEPYSDDPLDWNRTQRRYR